MAVPRLRVEIDYEQLKKAGIDIPKLFAGMGVAAETTERKMKQTERALKSQENAFHRLKASLDPAFAAQQKYTRSVELLDDAFRRKLIKSQEEYNRLLSAAKGQYSQGASGLSRLGGELKSMATSYLSIAAAVGVFTAAIRGSIREALEAEKAYNRLTFAVNQNAARIGFSADELAKFAGQLQSATTFDDDSIMGAMEALSRFSAVNGQNIQELTKLTLDYAAVTGKDAVSAAQALGKAFDEPGESMRALKEIGIQLNRVEEDQINLLMESGREWEAQAIIFQKLRDAVAGKAADELKTYAGQWAQLKNGIAEAGEKVGDFLIKLSVAYAKSTGFMRHWAQAGEMPETQTRIVPLERFGTGRGNSGLVGDAGMEAASQRVIRALDAQGKAAIKASKDVATATKELGNLKIETLETATAADRLNAAFGAENFNGPDASAYARVQEIMADSVSAGEKLAEIQTLLNYAVEKKWISEEKAAAALRDQSESLGFVKEQTKDVADEWEQITKNIQENFVRGVQTAFADFFVQIFQGGEDALENFGKALKDMLFKTLAEYLAQWLITQAKMLAASMKRIATEAAAQKAANAGGGASGGGGGGGGWMGALAKMFKGGGSGGGTAGGSSAMGTWGGIAIAAITVAAALYNANKHRQQREGGKRETSASLYMEGGDAYSAEAGRLRGTAAAVSKGMLDLFNSLNDTARGGVLSMDRATIEISNNKKYFDAKINGILIGKFTSIEEATVAAVGRAFATAEGDIDSVLRSSMQNFTGKSPEDMTTAAKMIQEVADAFHNVAEMDVQITSVASNARALTEELKRLGVAAMDAQVTGVRSMVVGFRSAWESLSGTQLSPADRKEQAERSRALLLAQMKLERAKLAADIKILEIQSRIARSGNLLKGAELRGETIYLQAQGKLWDAELDMAGGYLKGRGQYVKAQGTLFNAELEAMQAVLIELDKLIGTVSIGKIKLGGGGRRGGGHGGGSYQDRLVTAIERLINAVTALREFQESLKQDEQLSPYGTAARFAMARNSFNTLAQQAMGGNVSAIENLPEAARLYLELAQQMYGRAGAGYGNIFEQVQALLQAISDQYPEGQDPQAWLRSDMEAVNRYLESLHLDGRRRREQHDQTNRTLDRQEDLLRQIAENQTGANGALTRILSTQRATPVRNGGMRAA